MIEVEEIALGPVLRKLDEMPGIARLHLDLEGPGGKTREVGSNTEGDESRPGERPGRGETLARTIALLMQGPKTLDEISAELGGDRQRAPNATYLLRKKKFITKVRKTYKLTAKATAELRARAAAAPAALPSPKKAPAGRMTPGSGPIMLRAVLGKGPVPRADLNARLAAHGITPKSIPGVIDRGKRDRIIRKNGSQLYELTAKGKKIELPEAAAHG